MDTHSERETLSKRGTFYFLSSMIGIAGNKSFGKRLEISIFTYDLGIKSTLRLRSRAANARSKAITINKVECPPFLKGWRAGLAEI
jgi:hypothetical protein